MKTKFIFIALITTFFVHAQNIFQEDFTTYTTGIPLDGQGTWSNNSSNPGGTGGFPISSFAKVILSPVFFEGYGNSDISVELKPESDGCGRGFAPVTSGSIYVGFVINLSAAQNNSVDFFRVMSGGNFNTTFRLYAQQAPGAFFIASDKNAGIKVATALSYSLNQDHLVIVKYTTNPGANDDVITVYVDPTFINGEPLTPSMVNNTGTDLSGNIDRLCIRQNGNPTLPTGKIGLISVSTTWNGLTFLPLSNEQFTNSDFIVSSNQISSGLLSVKSNISLENATLNIYDIQGKKLETKTISLTKSINAININPITNTGVYVVEISANGSRFSQKVVVN